MHIVPGSEGSPTEFKREKKRLSGKNLWNKARRFNSQYPSFKFYLFFTGGFPADDCELALVLGNIIMVI